MNAKLEYPDEFIKGMSVHFKENRPYALMEPLIIRYRYRYRSKLTNYYKIKADNQLWEIFQMVTVTKYFLIHILKGHWFRLFFLNKIRNMRGRSFSKLNNGYPKLRNGYSKLIDFNVRWPRIFRTLSRKKDEIEDSKNVCASVSLILVYFCFPIKYNTKRN